MLINVYLQKGWRYISQLIIRRSTLPKEQLFSEKKSQTLFFKGRTLFEDKTSKVFSIFFLYLLTLKERNYHSCTHPSRKGFSLSLSPCLCFEMVRGYEPMWWCWKVGGRGLGDGERITFFALMEGEWEFLLLLIIIFMKMRERVLDKWKNTGDNFFSPFLITSLLFFSSLCFVLKTSYLEFIYFCVLDYLKNIFYLFDSK